MKTSYAENYGSPVLVGMWSDYVDWEKRRRGEKGFLARTLARHGAKKVLDACLGDGCDSIHLIQSGFDVESNEVDPVFTNKALENAARQHVKLRVHQVDWRKLSQTLPAETYDAVMVLGNSLTYLLTEKGRQQAVDSFHKLLKPGGVLLIDTRNYDYILRARKRILAGKFRFSKKYYYCGDKVNSRPVEIRPNKVVFQIQHDNGATAYCTGYPLRRKELHAHLARAGFRAVRGYSDFTPGHNPRADFFQYVAVK